MRRLVLTVGLLALWLSVPAAARAQSTPPLPASPPVTGPTGTAFAPTGLGVIALPGATDAAWPLAQALYADISVRAATIDEPHARVLCGEPPGAAAPADLRDLGTTVSALKGEDAPSRAMLSAIAQQFAVRALVVVSAGSAQADGLSHPTARVFLPSTSTFDPITYEPDQSPSPSGPAWTAATRTLVQSFGAPAAPPALSSPTSAPPFATHPEPITENSPPHHSHFYESGWFWGAIAAAALGGGAIFFATRDNSAQTIHLKVQTSP